MTPTLFALLVCVGGVFASRTGALTLQVLWSLFGATAAILLPALGGATITPAVLFLPFLLARALSERGVRGCLRQTAYPDAGFWLLLLAMWGMFSAYFLPRLFAGEVLIRTYDRYSLVRSIPLVGLHPVSGNITQVGYALGGLVAFLAVRVLLEERGRLDRFRDAVLLLAGLNCLAAVINVGELYFGLPSMLEYVRNGGYAILVGGELGGLQRVSGTFPETSAFSAFTLPLFAFTFSLWLSKVRPTWSAVLALASLAFLLISTSGTAYFGLAVYLVCLGLALAWRGLARGNVPRLGALLLAGMLGQLILCAVLIYHPEAMEPVARFFDATVGNKMQSLSGIERSSWNQQAWSNFLDTYGIGIGLGSAQASSFPLVLLSNVGVIGTLFFLAFVVKVLKGGQADSTLPAAAVTRAARHAVLATLIAASISGRVFDLGVAFYAFAAAASIAVPELAPVPKEVRAYA